MILLKLLVVTILFVPTLLLTLVIWLLGGWTQGFDYMPNPVYGLFDWLES